jgi:hypothetical protein
VFGFLANKTFIMEYNVIPDDTSIVSYSDPEKITFTTVAGKCNAPSIT